MPLKMREQFSKKHADEKTLEKGKKKLTTQPTDTFEVSSDSQIDITNVCITRNDRRETFDELKRLGTKNIRNPNLNLNIISVRNKFDDFSELIANYVDIIILAETKLDSTFPKNQFSLLGFKAPIRVDCSANSREGGF